SRSSQMYDLGLSHCVCDRDGSRVESHDLRLEQNRQGTTAPGSQACTTVIRFQVVASYQIAGEVNGCGLRIARIVEKRNRQRSAKLAHGLKPEIQSRARRHSEWARHVGGQLHGKTSAIDLAVRRCGAGALQGI